MGFAQKLGQFAGGFSEGLLPGIQVGTDIAESKSRRAAAATRENRLAKGAEKAMLWKMFELDPAGAMAKAESLGYSELATSFRRKTKGTIGAKYAAVGAGMSNVAAVNPITDFTLAGLQAQAGALGSNLDTRRAASGAVDTTRASVPEELRGLASPDALIEQRTAFDKDTALLGNTLTATQLLISSIGKLNYNQEDYLTNIDEATNAYIQATGKPEAGEAIKSELLRTAKETQFKTYEPIINSMKGDAVGLGDLMTNSIVMGNPTLALMTSTLLGNAEREKDLTPEQKRELERVQAEADALDATAKLLAQTDPELALDFFNRSIKMRADNGIITPETAAMLEKKAENILDSSTLQTRQDIVLALMEAVASNVHSDPSVTLRKYGRFWGIEIPPGTTGDDDIVTELVDKIMEAGLEGQEKSEVEDITPIGAMLNLLNNGELDIAIQSMNEFAGDPTAPELIRALRANGWEWSPLPVPGQFTKIEEGRDVQPEPVQKPTATGRSTATGQSNEQLRQNIAKQDSALAANPGPPLASGQQLPFLPGQQRQ